MKIGILTYHRAHNYGAILQAIATRATLQDMGHEAYYVDYWPDYHKRMYRVFNYDYFKSIGLQAKFKYILLLLTKHTAKKKRIATFNSFLSQYIEPYCLPSSDNFDIIIIGSDQIWRRQGALNDFNKVYFGCNDFNAIHQYTYAASMGVLPQKNSEIQKVKQLLSSVERISVRESDLKQLVESLGFKAELHLDPTLLLDPKKWNELLPPTRYDGEPYVLYYNFQGGAFDRESIKTFASKRGWGIKSIVGGVRQHIEEGEQNTAGPLEFINLIRNAQYIFTSSFHGLAFSLIFNKQFYASFTKNRGRAKSLLMELKIEDRLLSPSSKIPEDATSIDYTIINDAIIALRKSSINYLSEVTSIKD